MSRHAANLTVVAARLLSVAAGLAYVKAYTGALATSEVGSFFYLSTLSYAVNALVFVPVDFYMQAKLAATPSPPSRGLILLIVRALIVGLIVCVALSAPLIWLGKLRVIDVPTLYVVSALLYLCSSMRNLINNRGSKAFVASMILLEVVARLLAFVAAAALFHPSASTLMWSSALALTCEFAVIMVWLRRTVAWSDKPGVLDDGATILRGAAPISGAAVCNALQLQTYRVAYPLADLGAASGIYGVVSNIGSQGMLACSAIFSQIHTPRLYQTEGRSIAGFVALAALLATGVLATALALAPWLVHLLTKDQYVPFAMAIGFGVVTEACNLIIGGYIVVFSIQRRTGLLLKANVIAAFGAVAGCLAALSMQPDNPFLIGWAAAGSQVLLTLVLVFITRKLDVTAN